MELNYCYNCMEEMDPGQLICPRCGHDNLIRQNEENTLPEGSILNGKYIVGRIIGQGGFGITYLGCDLNLKTRVAIKEYYPSQIARRVSGSLRIVPLQSDKQEGYENGCQEFQEEARRLARFNSPGIVRVRDYFRENGTAYIVMDYVEGSSLTKEFRLCNGKMPWKRVLALCKPLMLELDDLHEEHLIHRDIKPDNLKVAIKRKTGEEYLVLLDFGAARSFISSNVTQTYESILTPGFAPSEQYSKRSRQGPYTDVYALCATMYFLITGIVPPAAMDRLLYDDELRPFSDFGVTLPAAVEKALLHGLAVKSSDRTQTMKSLYDELSRAVSDNEDDEKKPPKPGYDKTKKARKYCIFCLKEMDPEKDICPHCGKDNSVTRSMYFCEDHVLNGKYFVGYHLDQDSFGIDYPALDLTNQKKFLIKEYFPFSVVERRDQSLEVVPCDYDSRYDYRLRYQQELEKVHLMAERLEAFRSPNLSRVFHHFIENNTIYMVMEHEEGLSFREWMKQQGGKVPWKTVWRMVKPLALELERFHKNDLIQGKIDPGNILVKKVVAAGSRWEELKLQRFSFTSDISYIFERDDTAPLHFFHATDFYQAREKRLEENMKPKETGPWSDVYSLCAVMYFAITDRDPSDSCFGKGIKSFAELGLSVPEAVEKAIFHGLEESIKNRTRSMKQLCDEMDAALKENEEKLDPLLEKFRKYSVCVNCMTVLKPGQKVCPECGWDNSDQQKLKNRLEERSLQSGKYLWGWEFHGSVDSDAGVFGPWFIGMDLRSGKKVKIKVYSPMDVAEWKDGQIFIPENCREAYLADLKKADERCRILEKISSSQLVPVREHFYENGTLYIVTDYVGESTLLDELKNHGGRLPWQRVVSLMLPLIGELEKLHQTGQLHGNIRPEHMMSENDYRLKKHEYVLLCDYLFSGELGAWIYSNDPDWCLTYLPVEMIAKKSQEGPYSDVYSLCAVMYHCITGAEPPLSVDILMGHDTLRPFGSFGLDVPFPVENVIMHGLALQPKDRIRTMRELYDALDYVSDTVTDDREPVYQEAKKLMQTGSYQKALKLFESVSGWRDADDYAKSCREKLIQRLYGV